MWDVFIWPQQDASEREYLIEVDEKETASLSKHLKKHKLRSKITIRAVEEDDFEVLAAWGSEMKHKLSSVQGMEIMEDPRALSFGYRVLHNVKISKATDLINDYVQDLQHYHLRRYQFGIPEGQDEIPREVALPMEYNIDLSQGIHFGKGCYVGQELTIRTKHTGVVRKRVLPIQLYHTGDPIPESQVPTPFDAEFSEQREFKGADIKQLDDKGSIKKGRAAGKLVTRVGNVGLALCRLEMMTPMRVSAEGGTYRPGLEFGVQAVEEEGSQEGDGPLRIKAIVPPWLKEREEQLWGNGRQRTMKPE